MHDAPPPPLDRQGIGRLRRCAVVSRSDILFNEALQSEVTRRTPELFPDDDSGGVIAAPPQPLLACADDHPTTAARLRSAAAGARRGRTRRVTAAAATAGDQAHPGGPAVHRARQRRQARASSSASSAASLVLVARLSARAAASDSGGVGRRWRSSAASLVFFGALFGLQVYLLTSGGPVLAVGPARPLDQDAAHPRPGDLAAVGAGRAGLPAALGAGEDGLRQAARPACRRATSVRSPRSTPACSSSSSAPASPPPLNFADRSEAEIMARSARVRRRPLPGAVTSQRASVCNTAHPAPAPLPAVGGSLGCARSRESKG